MIDAAGLCSGQWCAGIWSLAFSPDSKTVATGSTDARVRLWDVETGHLLATSEALRDLVYSLAFSPDGRRLAAGDAAGHLSVWDLAVPLDSAPLLILDNSPTVLSVSFSPPGSNSLGGSILATGSGLGVIRLWDAASGNLLRQMQGGGNGVKVVYSPDGSVLAAGSRGFEPDYAVRLWDPGSGELRATLQGHTKDVGDLAFTPDGRILASSDWDGVTRLWDTATGEELQTLQQSQAVYGADLSPDGGRLATGGSDGLIWIWGLP
jgi:WD40 repeat protein